MNIFIDNRSGVPIYTQIHAQIRDQIISGTLQPEEPLPSIRTLARDLRISVITTKRAYDELEKEGLIYTVAGKGCFVAEKNLDLVREENLRRIEEDMDEIRALAGSCGLAKEEILEMWNTIWED
ncbi:MAG: GntR family transcriptional regulator [Solobacterium sp.]|nr:GntR family transcriptional regulator [Solobacterium sp.]MBQ6356491.1 GntR family transcriptional regulator [Solobacterium sp.]MBR0213870.1 GntR family transcriptional regulator [Solobacterium sp.]